MAQHFFEVGAFSLRCSEMTSQTAVYEFEEMIKAMEDDRYNDDPAYREAILQKLERSNINF